MVQAKNTQEKLNEARNALESLTVEIGGTTDPAELKVLTAKVQRAGQKVEELAVTWQRQVRAAAGLDPEPDDTPVGGMSTIALTARQRELVLQETGLTLQEITLRGSVWPRTLPKSTPREVDHAILRAARSMAAQKDTTASASARIKEILAGDNDALKEQLTLALQDPGFLAGARPE